MHDRPLTLRIDPHVHSVDSYDAHAPAELILAQARDVGLDGVVVTDHDAIDESLRAAELAPEFGLIGIPGVELSTADGHLLAIGVERLPDVGRPLAESVAQVREMGGVAVVPHPFQRSRHGIRRRDLVDCDAIEAFNAWSFTGYRNFTARKFADRYGYPSLGASDAHSVAMVGRAYTELTIGDRSLTRGAVDGNTLLSAITRGATDFVGRRTPLERCLAAYAANAGRKTSALVRSTVASRL